MTDKPRTKPTRLTIPQRVGAETEVNYGNEPAPDFGPLARDRIPVRAMKKTDLRKLIDIDSRITGRNRADYFNHKLEEALYESDVRVSLVAERDGEPVGFIMARVDLGEFGRVEPVAVLDTIGVDPDFHDQGIGRALLSQLFMNLMTLRVEGVRTVVGWSDARLISFLDRCGFHPSQRLCLEFIVK